MNSQPGVRVVRGVCPLDCPNTCSWIVTVKNGGAVELRGDAAHPYTRGSLCNKVDGYLEYARSSDRVRPGVVASTKGRWPGLSKKGATINATVDARDSDVGKGAVYHDNRVSVERVDEARMDQRTRDEGPSRVESTMLS